MPDPLDDLVDVGPMHERGTPAALEYLAYARKEFGAYYEAAASMFVDQLLDQEDPMAILLACEIRDATEGWAPGTALEEYYRCLKEVKNHTHERK